MKSDIKSAEEILKRADPSWKRPPGGISPATAAAVLGIHAGLGPATAPRALKPPAPSPRPTPDEKTEPGRVSYAIELKTPTRTPEEIAEWEWKYETLPNVVASGIPERYRVRLARGEWGSVPQERMFYSVRRKLKGNGAIVAMVGKRGTGKTTIAGQLLIDRARMTYDEKTGAIVKVGEVGAYRKLTGVVAKLKAIYSDFGTIDEEHLTAVRDALCRHPLAIFDEVHEAIADNRIALPLLTDILDRRYSARLDTLLISNQTKAEFDATMGDSILSRIAEHGRVLPCEWESWRERIGAAAIA